MGNMSYNEKTGSKPIYLSEKRFVSLQTSARFQMLIFANESIYFVPLPKLATTLSEQVIVMNEKTGMPEQVYYDKITAIVVDGHHFNVRSIYSKNPFVRVCQLLVELFS